MEERLYKWFVALILSVIFLSIGLSIKTCNDQDWQRTQACDKLGGFRQNGGCFKMIQIGGD